MRLYEERKPTKKKFYVYNQKEHCFQEVAIKQELTLSFNGAQISAFLFKDGYYAPGKWNVTEAQTGTMIAFGSTMKNAIENAESRLRSYEKLITADRLFDDVESKPLSPRYQ